MQVLAISANDSKNENTVSGSNNKQGEEEEEEEKEEKESRERTRDEFLYSLVIENVLRWIEFMCTRICHPQLEVFIAIDGVPPRAKMVQQRSRRYISAQQSLLDEDDVVLVNRKKLFDSACVTPGTTFMKMLAEKINASAEELKTKIGVKELNVSDSTQPGEGEHKIFSRIRSLNKGQQVSESVIIYGADADLFMLSMLCPVRTVYVVREDNNNHNNNNYHHQQQYGKHYIGGQQRHFKTTPQAPSLLPSFNFVNIDLLRSRLTMLLGVDDPREFVTLSLLLGNDFIPPLSYLRVRDNGIDILAHKYKAMKSLHQTHGLFQIPTTKDNTDDNRVNNDTPRLDYSTLLMLLTLFSEDESCGLQRLEGSYELDKNMQTMIRPNTPGWRNRYYTSLFFPSTNKNIASVCDQYINGMCWTFAYYFSYDSSRVRLSDWHYPHAYSPTALDILNHLRSLGNDGFRERENIMREQEGLVTMSAIQDPTVQLLYVLPPTSSNLLPRPVRCIMQDLSKGCLHFYPKRFQLATYLKHYASDFFAVLPDIDGEHLFRTFQRVMTKRR